MKKLKLIRAFKGDTYTIGHLSVNGIEICDTLEDKVREPGVKIYGKTAIPASKYKIEIKHSPSFNRPMPYLINVPKFTNVMIHPGNNENDTLGCILVGKNTIKGGLTQSISTFQKLWEMIKDDNDITVEII